MPRQYRTREGEAIAVDTKTQLTTLGSESSPGPLLVPSGSQRLTGVVVAAASNFAAVGSAAAMIRLEGAGLPEGPETLVIGATGTPVATGVNDLNLARFHEIGAAVTPGNEILVFGEMVGADIGQISVGVSLVFD